MRVRFVAVFGLLVLPASCGGTVQNGTPAPESSRDAAGSAGSGGAPASANGAPTSAGASSMSAGGAWTTAGDASTLAGDASTPASDAEPAECRIRNESDPVASHGCPELRERLVVTDPVVKDDDGDGRFAPGERVHVTVSLTDRSGFGFNLYPALTIEVVDPDGRTESIGGVNLYALGACQSHPVEATFTLAENLAHGATVHVVARVAALMECEDTNALVVPIVVD